MSPLPKQFTPYTRVLTVQDSKRPIHQLLSPYPPLVPPLYPLLCPKDNSVEAEYKFIPYYRYGYRKERNKYYGIKDDYIYRKDDNGDYLFYGFEQTKKIQKKEYKMEMVDFYTDAEEVDGSNFRYGIDGCLYGYSNSKKYIGFYETFYYRLKKKLDEKQYQYYLLNGRKG